MNTTTQIENITLTPNTTIPQVIIEPVITQQPTSNFLIYLIAVIILIATFLFLRKGKSKGNKKEIGIIGERASGKTQLFLGLAGAKSFETVPSITNNIGQLKIGNSNFQICDFIGDNVSKEEVISQIARFHTLVHVVDGTDSKKLADAALVIYRILINKQFQREPCNYIVFLNKSDQKGFHRPEKLLKRIEDQIQTIKVTRRNQTEENQEGEEDYIRNQRSRFQLKKQGIQVIIGSAKQNRTPLTSALEELC